MRFDLSSVWVEFQRKTFNEFSTERRPVVFGIDKKMSIEITNCTIELSREF